MSQATGATEVRCPMIECRRRVDLAPLASGEAIEGCMHLIAGWPDGGPTAMAEAVMWGLEGNREFVIRNLRPPEVAADRIERERPRLEASARTFAHEVGGVALFGDVHERNRVAFEFAQLLLGVDPIAKR